MTNPMQPVGNPTVGGSPSADRFGGEIGAPYRKYMGGPLITAEMAVPDSENKCTFVGKAPRAAFLVRVPAGVTAFTVHYGRWVRGEKTHAALPALDTFVETGNQHVSGATAGSTVTVDLPTYTDAVGCYVDTFTGTVTPGESFQIWVRALPRE